MARCLLEAIALVVMVATIYVVVELGCILNNACFALVLP